MLVRALDPNKSQLVKVGGNTELVLAGAAKIEKSKRKAVVLEEDDYVSTLEHIIQRDFFPALTPLESTLNPQHRTASRPSTRGGFEEDTPVRRSEGGDSPDFEENSNEQSQRRTAANSGSMLPPKAKIKRQKKEDLTLDKFVHNFTSEDNAAFDEILNEDNAKLREKALWMSESVKQAAANVIKSDDPKRTGMLDCWAYQPKNALMFFPRGDGVLQNADAAKLLKRPEKEIAHPNTRFPGGFFDAPSEAEQRLAMDSVGVSENGTPMVGNYRLMRTPSPAVYSSSGNSKKEGKGGGGTPLMTWGDIVGTPLHIDEEDAKEASSQQRSNSSFFVSSQPAREAMAWKMVEENSAKARAVTPSRPGTGSRTPSRGSTPSAMRQPPPLSPAAHRLLAAAKKGKTGGDFQLRASYGTPNSQRSSSSSSTATPSAISRATPSRLESPLFAATPKR